MSTVLREHVEPGIEVLRLNRPAQRNALDSATLERLIDCLERVGADPDVRVVVLSSTSERALCAGADVTERLTAAGGVARMEAFARLYSLVESCPVPTVCVCLGSCVGAGAELVAGCDLRVGAANMRLAWAGARLGVPVGVARLVPLVGLSVAKELILSGRFVEAEEARTLGLLARSADPGEAEAVALELADELAALPGAGLRRLKAMFRDFECSAERVARENEILVGWQREGPGLPQG